MKEARAELVRIDAHGEAHPIGAVASQRMRARAGTYRLMPAPDHVVFMRFTGEDGRRDQEDGRVVRLAGEISAPGAMCDVLAMLAQAGWHGELVVLDGDSVRSVYLERGNVVGVHTNVDDERLGAVLYRFGAINAGDLDRITAVVRPGKRFGAAALELGLLTREQVYAYIGKQVEEVVFATFAVSDGTFFFLEGFDESRLASRHTASASGLLMEGVRRVDEMSYFRQKIPTSEYVPVAVEGAAAVATEYAKVFSVVDGRLSVEEIGRESGLGEFEATKQLYTLLQSNQVALRPPRLSGGPAALVAVANSALRAIFQRADATGKGDELRNSLASFAVGAGVYDILFRDAGPDESGALDTQAVANNLSLVAAGADPENVLKQMLHEYVSFALFSAGAALGSGAEDDLKREVGGVLGQLRPPA